MEVVYLKEKPFSEHKIQLQKNDVFYLLSDGFYSQFGGVEKDKLKKKRFREFISDIHKLPIDRQKEALEKKYTEWIGEESQIDDILVLGVKVLWRELTAIHHSFHSIIQITVQDYSPHTIAILSFIFLLK